MPSITFQPTLRTLRDILSTDFYLIPRFQRPYSWSPENLDDFWADVVDSAEDGYFIGPMVSYGPLGGYHGIVDGQQRITTITLLLAAIRDRFVELGEQAQADGMRKYIEREDDENEAHFVLSSAAAGEYLSSQVLVPPPRTRVEPVNEDQRAIRRAADLLAARLADKLGNLSTTTPEGEKLSPAAEELRAIRDRVLGLQAIWIKLDNEDDAYVIFETLNSRGKDLEVIDLLKNLVLSGIKAENGDLDSARTRWNDMREALGESNPNKFVLHWWLSRYDYTAERALFRMIKKTFNKGDASRLLDELLLDAKLYAKIAHPERSEWKRREEAALRESLVALNAFGVRQPRPLLLSILRSYEAGTVKFARVREALAAIENYHFVTTAVVGVSSTGGVSRMYASQAVKVTAATTAPKAAEALRAMRDRLKDGLSPRATFVSQFGTVLRFSEEEPANKRLVQYTLSRIQRATRPTAGLDDSKCNIEHIAPQSGGQDWAASIGNLLWLNEKLNEKLSNKAFPDKREILGKHQNLYDIGDVMSATKWGEQEVQARAERLAELAYDSVWKIS